MKAYIIFDVDGEFVYINVDIISVTLHFAMVIQFGKFDIASTKEI